MDYREQLHLEAYTCVHTYINIHIGLYGCDKKIAAKNYFGRTLFISILNPFIIS